MSTISTTSDGKAGKYAGRGHARRTCPRCNGTAYRVPRRFVDVCLSLVYPVHRFRCDANGCDWEGNMRARPR